MTQRKNNSLNWNFSLPNINDADIKYIKEMEIDKEKWEKKFKELIKELYDLSQEVDPNGAEALFPIRTPQRSSKNSTPNLSSR